MITRTLLLLKIGSTPLRVNVKLCGGPRNFCDPASSNHHNSGGGGGGGSPKKKVNL